MIYIYSLINGELIIGKSAELPAMIKIIDPFYIMDSITETGQFGTKLTSVLTFSSSDCIVISEDKVLFCFPASDAMVAYYEKLVDWYKKNNSDVILEEAITEMEKSEKRYDKLLTMLRGNNKIN